MLKAAFTILRGMGSRVSGDDKDNIVGNAKLGLWVGERLLGNLIHYSRAEFFVRRLLALG
jgi:hypothetical protein